MPVITFEYSKLTKEQKEKLIEEFTNTAAEITGIPKEKLMNFYKKNLINN